MEGTAVSWFSGKMLEKTNANGGFKSYKKTNVTWRMTPIRICEEKDVVSMLVHPKGTMLPEPKKEDRPSCDLMEP